MTGTVRAERRRCHWYGACAQLQRSWSTCQQQPHLAVRCARSEAVASTTHLGLASPHVGAVKYTALLLELKSHWSPS